MPSVVGVHVVPGSWATRMDLGRSCVLVLGEALRVLTVLERGAVLEDADPAQSAPAPGVALWRTGLDLFLWQKTGVQISIGLAYLPTSPLLS
jgi:hypothetical protein